MYLKEKRKKILSLCHDLNTMVPLMNYMADHPDSKPRELVVIAEELNMKNECGMLPEISRENISGEVTGMGYEFLNIIFDNIHEKGEVFPKDDK